MTKGGTVTYNGVTYTVYSYTFASGSLTDYTCVIFDSGTNATQKTDDITVLAGVYCYYNAYDSNFLAT
jgi:hypothetical protein